MPRTNPKTPEAFSDRPNTRRASRSVHHSVGFLSHAALLLFVLFALGGAARAQQVSPPASKLPETVAPATTTPPAGETIDEDDVLRIDSNLVHIPALVTETNGRPVSNLRLEDFELRIDGQPKPLGELTRADTPVALAILFDNSSSLSRAREFEKQAATRFLTRIVRPIDRASIYSVSTIPLLVRPLTNSVPALVRTVEQFPEPEGATALFDSISEAATYLHPQEGRRVLVIVSDGNDTISDQSFDQALQRALKSDCQIYVVGTGDIESNNLADTVARRRLQVLAAQTGGALYVPRTVQDLDYAFEQISRDISQQYVLSYFPVDDPADGSFRVIDLRIKDRAALRVRAREGYYTAMGQARVRPRTIRGAKSTTQTAPRAAAPTRETQVASLDPLYTTPLAGAPARGEANASSNVTFKTKTGGATRRTPTRRGPQENADVAEPERTVAEERTNASTPPSSVTPAITPPVVVAASEPRPRQQMSFEVARAAEPEPVVTQTARTETANQYSTVTHPNTSAQTQPDADASPAPATPQSLTHASASPTPAASQTPPTNPPPTDAGTHTPVSGGVLNGRALRLPSPIYPQAAKTARASGNVTIEVEIDEEGRVAAAQAVSGHRMLHGAALQAARQARFSPTLLSGRPVRIKGTIVYNFIAQ